MFLVSQIFVFNFIYYGNFSSLFCFLYVAFSDKVRFENEEKPLDFSIFIIY